MGEREKSGLGGKMTGCNQCGECCQYLILAENRDKRVKPETRELLLTRGCVIKQGFILIPFPCPHLKPTLDEFITPGKGRKWSCNIYATRPQACKDFDGRVISHGRRHFVPEGCSMKEGKR